MTPFTRYFCVHGHFYQPPRGNPFSDQPLVEKSAAPYQNWNERITAECYRPNAELGNFEHISFNLGETLAQWLAANDPEVYERILASNTLHQNKYGMGNAVAQSMHHTILPLSRREDKVTQVRWGKAAFAHRYGHPTTGMWLPEMAVDFETLDVLVEQGIEWTILTENQVKDKPAGAGPFWINITGGKRIKVFVRDEGLSNGIAFNLGNFGGAGKWALEELAPQRKEAGCLTLIATDGETFGHHWPHEDQFLNWLLTKEAEAAGYDVVTLARYAQMVEPEHEVTLIEDTSWSSGYGLARWATGSADTPGTSYWKGALRRALDNLRYELDGIYEDELGKIDSTNAINLRNAYIETVLGFTPAEQFIKEQEVEASDEEAARLLKLVQAQYYRQQMYASCAFFFADLDDLSTRYGIANAAYAIRLTRDATGIDLEPNFNRDLRVAVGEDAVSGAEFTGADMLGEINAEIEA